MQKSIQDFLPLFFRLGNHLKDAHEEEGDTTEAKEWAEHHGGHRQWPVGCSELVAGLLCILWQLSDPRKAGGVGYPSYRGEDDSDVPEAAQQAGVRAGSKTALLPVSGWEHE